MIDLYALTSPNVRKIIIAMQEFALPHKLIFVDVYKGDQYKPEFVAINPNSKIPAIVDHDGPGGKPYPVFESGAILMYLAEKTGRFLPKETAARFEVIQWLFFQTSGMGPNFGQWVHFRRFAPAGNEYSVSRFHTEVRRLYDVLERRLGASQYVGGGEYSIADMAVIPWLRDRVDHGVTWEAYPSLARWYEEVTARPAVISAFKIAEQIRNLRNNASPDELDRFYGRGKYARA
jgi:GST-like protein